MSRAKLTDAALHRALQRLGLADADATVTFSRLTAGASMETTRVQVTAKDGAASLLCLRRSDPSAITFNSGNLDGEAALLQLVKRHGVPVPDVLGVLAEEE